MIRVQRTQAVGEFLRQHRDDAAREVDRGRALVGVFIQRLTRLDVVADVGDCHQQPPAVKRRLAAATLKRLAVDRVVKVARVFAVDGDQRDIAQVDAMFAVDRPQLVGQRRSLGQRLGRKAMRHFVLAHRDLDLHAGVVDLTQHFGNTSDGFGMQ